MAETKKVGKKTGPKGPSKMKGETLEKLKQAFSIDCTIIEACFYADISQDTYYRWKRANPELSESIERLRHTPILAARQKIVNDIQTDGNMAKWYLERKRRKEFNLGTEDANAQKALPQPILQFIVNQKADMDKNDTKRDVVDVEVVNKSPEISAPDQKSNIMDDING